MKCRSRFSARFISVRSGIVRQRHHASPCPWMNALQQISGLEKRPANTPAQKIGYLQVPAAEPRAPLWPGTVLEKAIRPAVLRAGIHKKIGWHTFRHTYSTLLIANGENVKVVQELMRHASSRFTLEIYSQACLIAKREAQRRLVEAILPERTEELAPAVQSSSVSLTVNRIER